VSGGVFRGHSRQRAGESDSLLLEALSNPFAWPNEIVEQGHWAWCVRYLTFLTQIQPTVIGIENVNSSQFAEGGSIGHPFPAILSFIGLILDSAAAFGRRFSEYIRPECPCSRPTGRFLQNANITRLTRTVATINDDEILLAEGDRFSGP
jgi:hypothetical protein